LRPCREVFATPFDLFELPGVYGHIVRPTRDIVPEILDQLEFLGSAQREKGRGVGGHRDVSTEYDPRDFMK